MSAGAHDWRLLGKKRTYKRTQTPPDTRSEAEKARDGIPQPPHEQRGRYMGGPGKRLLP